MAALEERGTEEGGGSPCADMAATWLPCSVSCCRGWRPRRCQLYAIEASGYSLHSLSNIGVEAAVSKHWGEKRTKHKHWGFPDYYPLI